MNEYYVHQCEEVFNLPSYMELIGPVLDYKDRLGFESYIADAVVGLNTKNDKIIRPLIITGHPGTGKTILACSVMPKILNHFGIATSIYGSLESMNRCKTIKRKPYKSVAVIDDASDVDIWHYLPLAWKHYHALTVTTNIDQIDAIDFNGYLTVQPIVIETNHQFNRQNYAPIMPGRILAFANSLSCLV